MDADHVFGASRPAVAREPAAEEIVPSYGRAAERARADASGDGPLYADRVRVYPRAVSGPYRSIKWVVLIVCLAIYYLTPWIRFDRGPGAPDQAVLADIVNGRGYFFWIEIWPQEVYYLTGLLIIGAVALFLVTSLFGRVWCGYSCPQTVWTDLFMLVERWIEGDRVERMRFDKAPFGIAKVARKSAKHVAWLLIAMATGGVWVLYFNDAPATALRMLTGEATLKVYFFFALFTATTYLLGGIAREQVCTYMCPWPRFQAAMQDEQTLAVTYQRWRGEPRGKHKAGQDWSGRGDCVDCRACIAVCPTGIDIRDGQQLECINCGLCVDACNDIMKKVGRPAGLIAFATAASQVERAAGRAAPYRLLRLRTAVYAGVLALVGIAMLAALALRPAVTLTVIRDRQPLYVTLADGSIRNGYTLKIANRTREPRAVRIVIERLAGADLQLGDGVTGTTTLRPDAVAAVRVFVRRPRDAGKDETEGFHIALLDMSGATVAAAETQFIAPGRR